MKILITGGQGQLGQEVRTLLEEKNIECLSCDRKSLDITDISQCEKVIQGYCPDIIYHCAAYTAVDLAENVGKEDNYQVNVVGTENIARVAQNIGATLVYISTDYVFDGENINGLYKETDKTNPLNEYGKAKLQGEMKVKEHCKRYYIIRTSWVFGEYGNNFVHTMKRLAEKNSTLTIIDDQVGRPTWTKTISEFMLYAVQEKIDYGIYQLSNEGQCSWYGFAKEILKEQDIDIIPIQSSEFKQEATRPKYSVMSLEKVKNTGFSILTWQEALIKMLKNSKS